MQPKTLLAAALAWSVSSAQLIPLNAMSIEPGTSAKVGLLCTGCAIAQDKLPDTDVRAWDVTGDDESWLMIDVGLSADGRRVELNEQPFYPFDPSTPFEPLAEQAYDDFKQMSEPLRLSTKVEYGAETPEGSGTQRDVRIEILATDDRVVHVGTILVHIVEMETGELFVQRPLIVPTVTSLRDALCDTVLCRVRAQIADKAQMMAAATKNAAEKVKNGCARLLGMKGAAEGHKEMEGAMGMHHGHGDKGPLGNLRGGPKKFGGHGKKPCAGKHGFLGKLAFWFGIFVRHVLMPVMIGIAAGMAVSAIGMVIGQLVCMIYMRVRGERPGYVAVYQVEEDVEAGEEYEDGEPLPRYEAGEHALPPAYTDEKEEEQ